VTSSDQALLAFEMIRRVDVTYRSDVMLIVEYSWDRRGNNAAARDE